MNTIEGNKLIAEFMGFEIKNDSHNSLVATKNGRQLLLAPMNELQKLQGYGQVQFDSSWDWLMPVVEKISLWYDNDSDNFIDRIEEANLLIFRLSIFSNIKSVWMACIRFIEWYNKEQGVQECDASKVDSSTGVGSKKE